MSHDEKNRSVFVSWALSLTAWNCSSAVEQPLWLRQCWLSARTRCCFHTCWILFSSSFSHSFRMQSTRLSGRRSPAFGTPASVFGLRHNHRHFHWDGTSFACQSALRAVNTVDVTSSGQDFIMLNVSPVGPGAVFVDASFTTAWNSSYVTCCSKIASMSLRRSGALGTASIPVQMVSRMSAGMLCRWFCSVKYALSVMKRQGSTSPVWSGDSLCASGQSKWSWKASVRRACTWRGSVVMVPSSSVRASTS